MELKHLHACYGPTALVTGASSGIGLQLAEVLAESGFDLVLVARRKERLDNLAASLNSRFAANCHVVCVDLTSSSAIDTIVQACEGLDIGLVVSNAGVGLKGVHQDNDPTRMNEMLSVNCHMPMQLTHRFIPRLLKRERSGIILTSSVEALMGFPYSAAYASSKAFVNSLAEGLWGELQPLGIDVCAVCPGLTDTETHELQGVDRSKVGDMMSAKEVARLALQHVDSGPVYVVGQKNQEMFGALANMPRRDSLPIVGESMRQSLLTD